MPTQSSHIDEATFKRISETARLEDRKPSQITAAALRWYLRLSPGARDAMRRIEAAGDKAVDEAAWTVSRALLDQEYEALLKQGLSRRAPQFAADASEDDIMAEAVRLTRRR